MSARAACRLESLGVAEVYDYVAGKTDWLANGLPTEGPGAACLRVGAVACRDVPTCAPTEALDAVRDRVRASGWDTCVVVNKQRVVLGRLRPADLDQESAHTAEDAMELGPTTYRPDQSAADAAPTLAEHQVDSVLVTTSDGVLIGLLKRAEMAPSTAQARPATDDRNLTGAASVPRTVPATEMG